MKQKALNRPVLRRADAGVDSITVNGLPPGGVSGPINIVSDMATFVAPNTIRIDNGNTKPTPLVTTAPIVSNDIDTELYNSFFVDWEAGASVIPAPKAVTAGMAALGRKITFLVIFEGAPTDTLTFAGGANGYQFADANVNIGPTLADFNALVASIVASGVSYAFCIGFQYVGGTFKAFTSNWVCVALAGAFL